ncbi:MAG: hypothetical protein JEZ07_02770 [Phycisphaerae bacterium]|nr:hypothetical protein [Phycisphaerae bacterium]
MTDLLQAVREIKRILTSTKDYDKDELLEHAQVHARACQAILEKVFFCNKLINENKLTEASKLARQSPDLKEQLELADFEEVVQWWKLCQIHGLPATHLVIPDMINDVISIIYAAKSKTDLLLRKHRWMALAKAPLKHRLLILRDLALADPGNDIWKKDIEVFEEARLHEIATETVQAEKQGDLPALNALAKEINAAIWHQKELVEKAYDNIITATEPLHKKAVHEQYDMLAEKLCHAHELMDHHLLLELTDKWDMIYQQSHIAPSTQQVEITKAAITIAREISAEQLKERNYQKTCLILEKHIDDNDCDLAQIDKLAADALSFQQGIPELLAVKYNSKRSELEKHQKNKFIIKISLLIAALVLIAIGAGLLIIDYNHKQQVDQWKKNLTEVLHKEDIKKANNFFSSLDNEPKIKTDPQIIPLIDQYNELVKKEEQRIRQLAQLLNSFATSPIESVLSTDIDKALKLARSDEDKLQIEPYRQKQIEYQNKVRIEANKTYDKILDQLEADFARLKSMDDSNNDTKYKLASDCRKRAKELKDKSNAYAATVQRAKAIMDTSSMIIEHINTSLAIDKALETIGNNYTQPTEYKKLCQQFLDKYPALPISVDIQENLSKCDSALALYKWHSLAAIWQDDWFITDQKESVNRLAKISVAMTGLQSSPQRQALEMYIKYLEITSAVFDETGLTLAERVIRDLNKPVITSTKVIEHDLKKYYVPASFDPAIAQKNSDGDIAVEYYCDRIGSTRTEIFGFNKLRDKYYPAAHSVLAQEIHKKLSDVDLENWMTCFIDISIMCAQNKEADLIINSNFIKLFNTYSLKILPFNNAILEKISERLDEINLDIAWMDPKNTEADTIRPQAQWIINDTADLLEQAKAQIQNQMRQLSIDLILYNPVGVYLGKPVKLPEGLVQAKEIKLYFISYDTSHQPIMAPAGFAKTNNITINPACRKGNILYIRSDDN